MLERAASGNDLEAPTAVQSVDLEFSAVEGKHAVQAHVLTQGGRGD
jgi:hypothetical protein